jgi:phosphoribosyl-ATP pyrophosphohydrolase
MSAPDESKTFEELFDELGHRISSADPSSRTVELISQGTHAIGKKIVEEASEVWMAAEYQSPSELAEEISQLLYHVQVLMHAHKITPNDVYKYL